MLTLKAMYEYRETTQRIELNFQQYVITLIQVLRVYRSNVKLIRSLVLPKEKTFSSLKNALS